MGGGKFSSLPSSLSRELSLSHSLLLLRLLLLFPFAPFLSLPRSLSLSSPSLAMEIISVTTGVLSRSPFHRARFSPSRENRGHEREERGEIIFLFCRFFRSDPRVDRTDFDRSGFTRILKERGHQINVQKCSRLKSRYLTIWMELGAKISWA